MLDSLFEQARETRKTQSRFPESDNPDAIVERVIRLAALFDSKLAESYANRYSSDDLNSASSQGSTPNAAQNASLRLRLALQLVDKAPAASVSVARGSLDAGIFPETLTFLSVLRKKDAKLASHFFSEALGSIQRRGGLDVNELFLLYAYVFSPLRIPVATQLGIGVFSIPDYNETAQNYSIEPTLARLYSSVATELVVDQNRLNPQVLPLLTNGIEGDYYFISVILPAVTNYVPELGNALLTRRSVLSAMLIQDRREFSESSADQWTKTPNSVNLIGGSSGPTVDYLLERAEKTADQTRKDRLYYQAATKAVLAKQYERAIKIVEKLSGPYSADAKQFILFDVALNAARSGDVDTADIFARRDDDLARRAFVFTTSAASLLKAKPADAPRAAEFLREAAGLAAKIVKEGERVAVLFGLASVYSRFDVALASQMLAMGIQSANKVEGFGHDAKVHRAFRIGAFLFDYSLYANEFTFTEAIRTIGGQDFNGTLSQIAYFKNRFPRLKATVLTCDAVLAKLPKA